MMRLTKASALCAAVLGLLAGCKPTTIVTGPPEEHANAAMHVTLPPAVKASYTYRCTDNSVIYVDFLSDDVSANLRTKQMGATTTLRAPAAGNNFAGSGYEITGSGKLIDFKSPKLPKESCRA
jgi:hypothetical protein